MDHGSSISDQAYHYETPSISSNHNENILLLIEGQFEEPEVLTTHSSYHPAPTSTQNQQQAKWD
jgi:hypothetical protein